MPKERFCAELGCDRLVAEENESKCSKHRVHVGNDVIIKIVLGAPEIDFIFGSGKVTEIDAGGFVHVDFGEDRGLENVPFPSRLFRQRSGDDGWELKAQLR